MSLRIGLIAGSLDRGGAERQLIHWVTILREEGHRPLIYTFSESGACQAEVEALGVEIRYVGRGKSQRIKNLLKFSREDNLDLIQAVHLYTSSYSGLIGKLLRIPSIGSFRSNVHFELENAPLSWTILRLPDYFIINSRDGLDTLRTEKNISTDKTFFLPNATNLDVPACQFSNDVPVVLFLGRIVQEKRIDRFFSIMKKVYERIPELEFKIEIVGNGSHYDFAREQEKHSGLPDGIVAFRGEVSDVSTCYEAADVCVLSSDLEGTPNTVLESFAYGLPVVTTDVSGFSSYLPDSVAMIHNQEDEDGMAASIVELLEDREKRMLLGRAGREWVNKNHSVDRVKQSLLEIYNSILNT